MSKAFVLMSGGVDSTTCLHIAMSEFGASNVRAMFVNYGQRHRRELDFAAFTCGVQGVPFDFLDLSQIIPPTMLTVPDREIPSKSYDELDPGVSPTYVPFRNGLMLSAAVSKMFGTLKNEGHISNEGGEDHALYFGAHAEDAQNWAYADCTPEFIGAEANAIFIGTYRSIRLHTPLQWMGKADIIQVGDRLGVDWRNTWSCYKGGEKHCGVCPTCRARRQGFLKAGIHDPTEYLE